ARHGGATPPLTPPRRGEGNTTRRERAAKGATPPLTPPRRGEGNTTGQERAARAATPPLTPPRRGEGNTTRQERAEDVWVCAAQLLRLTCSSGPGRTL